MVNQGFVHNNVKVHVKNLFKYDHLISGRILHDKAVPSDTRVSMLPLLAFGAGQDDIDLHLQRARKDHLVMNYAQEFDRLPILEQEAVALFVSIKDGLDIFKVIIFWKKYFRIYWEYSCRVLFDQSTHLIKK